VVTRSLDVYGPLREAEARAVRGAASTLGLEVSTFDSPMALAEALDRRIPVAVLVVAGCDGCVEVMAHLRGQVRFAGVAVLALSEERRDRVFAEVYTQGGDDVVDGRSLRGLVTRLRPLAERSDTDAPAPQRGCVVVAATDANWRAVVGRMVANAGLLPMFVNNAQDAFDAASAADTRFVIARDDLPPDGALAAVDRCRRQAVAVPWVLVAPAKRATALRTSLTHTLVAVVDALAPPDHLLFIANDLGRSQLAERRSTPRLLFRGTVGFRPAGHTDDEVGFTYNVSAGGLYVRTLAPPPSATEVWLEIAAPTLERTVRLVGQVAWRRAFGPNECATVPPGFGVRITAGLPGDVERWAEACYRLGQQMGSGYRVAAWEKLSQVPPSLAASTVT
jgi:hypothetical protein